MAGTAVGKFFGEFGLDIDPFLKAVRGIQSETKSIENSLKPLKTAAEDVGKSFAAAGAAVTAALGLMVKQAADYGDAIRDASIRTGLSTQQLGGLKIAAEQSGASFEDMNIALKKLAVNVDAAARGNKEQIELFKSMGVNIRDASGQIRPINDLLGDLSEHFKNSTNATKEAGEAVQTFGKSGTQMIEFLELGKDGLQGFQDKADKLGLSLDQNAANAADKFKDTLNDLHAAETGVAIAIGNALIPTLTDLAEVFVELLVHTRAFIKENELLVKVVAAFGVLLTGAGGLLLGFAGLLVILPKVVEAWKLLNVVMIANPIGAVITGIALLTAGLYAFRYELQAGLVGNLSFAVHWLGEFAIAAGKVLESFGATGLGSKIEAVGQSIVKFGNGLKDTRDYILQVGKGTADLSAEFAKAHEAFDAAAHQKISDGFIADAEAMKKAAEIAKKYREALADLYRDQVERAAKFVKAIIDGFERTSDAADNYSESLQKLQVKTSELAFSTLDAVIAMQEAWDNASTGKAFDAQVDLYNKIHGLEKTDLDDKVEFDEAWNKALNKQNAKRLDDIKKTNEQVRKSAGAIFDDMLIKGEGVFKSLQNMLKGGVLSLGRTIFEDITGALLGPVLQAFKDFFNTTLKGIIQGAFGGLGKSIGGALAGIFGGGVPHLPGGAAGPVLAGAGGTAGGIGISGAALAAFATNPITIGVAAAAAAALAIKHFVGEGRKTADQFGSQVQGSFGASLSGIIDPFDAMKKAGTLTLDAAKSARDALKSLWDSFTATAGQFASQGKNQAKVVSQAFATMATNFGPGLSNLFGGIDSAIASLTGRAPGTAGALAGIPDTGRAVSASSIFANAVDVFKLAVDRVSGGGSIGAPISLNVSSAPVFNISVDSADLAFQVREVIVPEILKDLQGDVDSISTRVIQILKPRWDSTPSLGGAVA